MEKSLSRALLQTRSLRFWIMAGMLLALTPVIVAGVGGFLLLNHGVIASFQDIGDRQHNEIIPAQRAGLQLWDAATWVDEFVEEGNPTHQAGFRNARTAIDFDLAALIESLGSDAVTKALVVSAQEDWKVAEQLGSDLISVPPSAGSSNAAVQVDRFDGAIRSVSDKLEGVIERLENDIAEDQDTADLAYERALWLAGIAAGICLLTIIGAVLMIGRIMAASVDRLVDGALRFAEGERLHRIDIRIPPELRRVADEFNRMIVKIHAYEDLLAERAIKDVLTGLPNRRAFDEAIAQNWARVQQFGEPFAVLLIDIDHFKLVNDTHGHAAGDEVLQQVAQTLAQQLRTAHPVFRTGGEEFAVIVPNARLDEARVVAERLRAAVSVIALRVSGAEIGVTISIGVTDSQGLGGSDQILKTADANLYRAKSLGRNRVESSDDRHSGESAA